MRRALEYQVEVGRFWQAKRMVPVTNVHLMGDIEVMGDGGLEFLREEVRLGARCRADRPHPGVWISSRRQQERDFFSRAACNARRSGRLGRGRQAGGRIAPELLRRAGVSWLSSHAERR